MIDDAYSGEVPEFGEHGPKFKAVCPFAHCSMVYHGYTQKGVEALMAMHIDDHKRGWLEKPKEFKLTPEDKIWLKKMLVGWEDAIVEPLTQPREDDPDGP